MEVMESIDDLSVSRNKIIINSTQKVSSGVLNSRNMKSVARTSYSRNTIVRKEKFEFEGILIIISILF